MLGEHLMNGYGKANGSSNTSNNGKHFTLADDSQPHYANEWERFRTTYDSRTILDRGIEADWETQEASHYLDSKMAGARESERSSRQTLQGIRQVARVTASVAQRLVPIVSRILLKTAARPRFSEPMVHRLVQVLLQTGDLETEYLEAAFFGINAAEAEVDDSEAAYEAALTEVLAAEASHSHNPSEASAFIGTIVGIIVQSLGGRRHLHTLIPVLIAETADLVQLLHCQRATRLFRLIPMILRRTIVSLRSAPRLGCRITPSLVRRIFAAHAVRVFDDPRLVRFALIRNAVIRQRSVTRAIR